MRAGESELASIAHLLLFVRIVCDSRVYRKETLFTNSQLTASNKKPVEVPTNNAYWRCLRSYTRFFASSFLFLLNVFTFIFSSARNFSWIFINCHWSYLTFIFFCVFLLVKFLIFCCRFLRGGSDAGTQSQSHLSSL